MRYLTTGWSGAHVAPDHPAHPPVHFLARARSTARAVLVGLLCALSPALALVVAGPAGPAAAHAQVIASDPADGAVVPAAPSEITVDFNEPVRPADGNQLFRADGSEVPVEVTTIDRRLTVVPQDDLGAGTIVLTWSVTSADDHQISGSLTFSVGEPSAATPADAVRGGTGAAIAAVATGLLALLLSAVTVVAASVQTAGRRWSGPAPATVALVAVLAALAWLPLRLLATERRSWGDLLDAGLWLDAALSLTGLLVLGGAIALALVVQAADTQRRHHLFAASLLVAATAIGGIVVVPASPDQPAAALSEEAHDGQQVEAPLGSEATATVSMSSAGVGRVPMTVTVTDTSGDPVQPASPPTLRLSTEGVDLGDIPLEPTDQPGVWTANPTLPRPGTWTAQVSVRLTRFDNPVATLEFDVS